ncbi:hypothetical protein Fmac_017597 [Flemingia macrophylla]|uniref:Neprosin PEP catalytic domain-containing protein n=1 Tax=Flemingia macrophylla TaxID=520843 RepID=A0ABD1M2R9_9FABA
MCILCHKIDARNHTQQERIQWSRSHEFEGILVSREDEFDCVDIYKQPSLQHPLLKNHKIQFATLDTTPHTTYRGADVNINICAPSVKKGQYSLAQVYAQSGPPGELNTIQAGWGVFPDLYGDSLTRLTGYWGVEGYPKAGCFDTLCPGFVQIHQSVAFGIPLEVSKIGADEQFYLNFIIQQDGRTGHWWLTVKENIHVGYWPNRIFTHLANGASVIRFGGEAGAAFLSSSPPMGTGNLAEAKFRYACYFAKLQILDSESKLQEVQPEDMKIYLETDPKCYDLLYPGYTGPSHRQAFLFGGPGGNCGA